MSGTAILEETKETQSKINFDEEDLVYDFSNIQKTGIAEAESLENDFPVNHIDPHVHFRDGKQNYKETIKHGLELALSQGVMKIFDMPNTDPPIISFKGVSERLKMVPKDRREDYYLYIGATVNPEQLREAVYCYDFFSEVIGIKLFAGKSVGDLAVIEMHGQELVYETLSELGYKGVLAVHCEKESLINQELWNPLIPYSHLLARPEKAEVESVKDQIRFAKENNFKGLLHVCHVSSSDSVMWINQARKEINITCEATPHHLMYDSSVLHDPVSGLIYKVNPPIREKNTVMNLREDLKEGLIDWIGTDHAPHAVGEKLCSPYFSGIASLYFYDYFVTKFLPEIGVSKPQIKRLTNDNIRNAFRNKL